MTDKTNVSIAVLDDYQQVAHSYADWSAVQSAANLVIFNDHLSDEDSLVERLRPFQVICVMRERTPMTGTLLRRLPNLRMIVSTGQRNASIDQAQANEQGIQIRHTGYLGHGVVEMTWTLLLALAKRLPQEIDRVKNGHWQGTVGADLKNKTLSLLGLGNVGKKMAQIARAFDMHVLAWSENLTKEAASAQGVEYVTKQALFERADYLSVHLVLSSRSRGIVSLEDLSRMKPDAYFINTSRGPLADEAALLTVLNNKRIAGAALDVFDIEPLPAQHPFRTLPNVISTPHTGFVTEDLYRIFYGDTVRILEEWLSQQ